MAGDGRLRPEELDALLGAPGAAPTLVSIGEPDELVRGPAEGGWEQRLRQFLAAHRVVAWTLALVVVAVLTGGWWHATNRPPPLDTDIDATVVVTRVSGDGGDLIRTSLAVTPMHPGERLRAVALEGLALTQPTVVEDGDRVRTTNIASCSDLPDLAQPAGFTLRVTRTDSYGREVSSDLPIAGDGGRRIMATIVDGCVRKAANSMQLRYFAASSQGPAYLQVSLLNSSPWDLDVYGAVAAVRPRESTGYVSGQGTFGTEGGPVRLLAGDVTRVPLVPRVDECVPSWSGPVRWESSAPGGPSGDLTVYVGPAGTPAGTATITGAGIDLNPAQRAAVVHALQLPCAGRGSP